MMYERFGPDLLRQLYDFLAEKLGPEMFAMHSEDLDSQDGEGDRSGKAAGAA